MAYQEKPGDGVLFQNTKGTSDKSPSNTGYITAHRDIKAGEKLRLAGWRKGGQNGKEPFLSLKMSDDRRPGDETPRERQAPASDPFS
jgi:hypothetical protein